MEDFSSFHLPRLVDIDRNVTRNLSNELVRDDWAALILHYLGLDCIAHMRPKQLEMDAVVRDIYLHGLDPRDLYAVYFFGSPW